jgi:hypothetical protein
MEYRHSFTSNTDRFCHRYARQVAQYAAVDLGAFAQSSGIPQTLWCYTRIGFLDHPLEWKLHEAHRP